MNTDQGANVYLFAQNRRVSSRKLLFLPCVYNSLFALIAEMLANRKLLLFAVGMKNVNNSGIVSS